MEDILSYLALISLICTIVFIAVVTGWIIRVMRTDKHEECIVCGKILKKCKDKYYVKCAGQLCKKCYNEIYN